MPMSRPYDPARDPHPDPAVDGLLATLRRVTLSLARRGEAEAARQSFRQAIRVGERMGPEIWSSAP